MITQLRRLAGVDTLSDNIARLDNINSELKEIDSTIGEMAAIYSSRNEAKKELEKSLVDDNVMKSVNERFNVFQTGHLQETIQLKKNKDSLDKELKGLLSDKTILKAYNDLSEYNKFKSAYKQDEITEQVFDTFLKAKQGKVKYADNLVFNEKGELLLIQRAKTDKSNPEKWVLPGGHVDAGEDFKSAALRELNEEAGLRVIESKKVGEYSDKDAQIEYYRSNIELENQEVILETEESQDSVWIDPYKDLDKYEMVFNMKDNIKKILNISDNVTIIVDKYTEKIEKLNKRRDPENIEKGGDEIEKLKEDLSHYKDLIKEHVRLIKLLTPYAEKDKKIKSEIVDQVKELAGYKIKVKEFEKELKHEQKEVDLPEDIEKAIEGGFYKDEAIELLKSKVGVYSDNAQNRQLKRVGQKYGSSKQGQETPSKDSKQEEKPAEPKQKSPEELKEDAKNTSEPKLQEAIKNSDNPEVRKIAHEELKRRQDEEAPQEEKFGEPKKEDVQPKKDEKVPEKSEPKKVESKTVDKEIEFLSDKYKDIVTEAMNDDFLDSEKTKEIQKKQNEYSRYIQRTKEFDGVDKESEMKNAQKILGLQNEKEIKDFFGDGNIISIASDDMGIQVLCEDMFCVRDFSSKEVENIEFILNPELQKGKGRGTEIFTKQVNNFKNKGFEKINTSAAKSNIYNGYYTWARLGYGFEKKDDEKKFLNLVSKVDDNKINEVKSLQELMSFKKGRGWWKENGFSFRGTFDLSKESKSTFILNQYMEEKKNAKK